MNGIQAFWHYLYLLQHMTENGYVCTANRQSDSSTFYGGNCLQAFWYALNNVGYIVFHLGSGV